MRNVLIAILIVLIGWDVLTIYFGTLSIFSPIRGGVIERIMETDPFVHLVSVIFAIGLIVFILAYRIILNARNKVTLGILGVAFLYDFCTSFYGTAQAVGLKNWNVSQVAIVFLLSIMCTSAPLLIKSYLRRFRIGQDLYFLRKSLRGFP